MLQALVVHPLLDWSVIIGVVIAAGTIVIKVVIPGILTLVRDGKSGGGEEQAASRDIVEAINSAVTDFRRDMSAEVLRMTEWRTAQRNLAENAVNQMTELTREQSMLADAMSKLATAVAVVQSQVTEIEKRSEEAIRELTERSQKHGDAFVRIEQIASSVAALEAKRARRV